MGSDRNALCECQSGKKFKHCCAIAKPRSSHRQATAAVIVFAALAAWGVYGVAKRTFSGVDDTGTATVASRPPGPAPPGKEWSYAHGHWHPAQSPGLPQPEGLAPEGKVWSVEHGHWHDLDGSEPSPVEVDSTEGVSYTE